MSVELGARTLVLGRLVLGQLVLGRWLMVSVLYYNNLLCRCLDVRNGRLGYGLSSGVPKILRAKHQGAYIQGCLSSGGLSPGGPRIRKRLKAKDLYRKIESD